jgi:hypothetical protein
VFFSFVYDDLGVSLWVIMERTVYQIMHSLMLGLYLVTFIIAYRFPKIRETPAYLKNFYLYPLVGSLVTFTIFLHAYKLLPFQIVYYVNEISISFHFIFLSRFIYIVSNEKKAIKIIAIFLFVLITSFIIYDCIYLSRLAMSFSNASLLLLSLFYFHNLFISSPQVKLSKLPSFWVCCGVFLGSGILIPAPALHKYLFDRMPELNYLLAYIASLGFFIMYAFFIKAFLCLPTLRKL